jgi:hypothetical protein
MPPLLSYLSGYITFLFSMNYESIPQYPIPVPPHGWDSTPPTEPGAYWFHREDGLHTILVEIQLKDGELSVCWLDQHMPLTEWRGLWRGPLKLLGEPPSRHTFTLSPQ